MTLIKEKKIYFHKQNISPLVRRIPKNNINYLVVPMVMMLEQCVMNGVLYIADAVNASVQEWNGRQVVIYHPKTDNGVISANNPDTFTAQNVGTIFNTKVSGGKLKAEAWLEINKLENIKDGRKLITMLENNENIDVSTGMRISGYEENGVFSNNEYTIVANQIIPDHLAILLDEKGACSWDDGAGFARNKEENALKDKELNHNKELPTMDRQEKVSALIKSGAIAENQREAFEKMSDGAFDSFESLAKQNKEQSEKITAKENKEKEDAEKAEQAENAKNKTLGELQSENKSLKGDVATLVEFKENTEKKEKQSHVDAIIANKDNKFTEDQLFAMPVESLENIASFAKKADYSGNCGIVVENKKVEDDEKYMQNAGNQPEKKEGE